MKKLIKNHKGTAEVIGTMLFIVILLFFFTNVYLWHDNATKDANQLFLQKVNSTFKIEQAGGTIVVTANGGSAISLSRLWIIDNNLGQHYYANLNVQVPAGETFNITFSNTGPNNSTLNVTTLPNGNIQVTYDPPITYPVTIAVINTLGIEESNTFQQPPY